MPHPRTLADLKAAVTAELDPAYTLVYREQGDTLPDDVVAAMVSGAPEWETDGGERLSEWAGEIEWKASHETADQLAGDIVDRWEREDGADLTRVRSEWEDSSERDDVATDIRERADAQWFTDLVNDHGKVLLRVAIPAMNEDAALSGTRVTPERFLQLLDFAEREDNLTNAAEVVDNASPEYNTAIGYALISVDLSVFLTMPAEPDVKVDLVDPHVWLGSPFSGSGWCSESAFTGTLTVTRGDLATDKDAFGYSWGDVVGGVNPSDFEGSLVVVPPVTRAEDNQEA
jgi:hypothetical protein